MSDLFVLMQASYRAGPVHLDILLAVQLELREDLRHS